MTKLIITLLSCIFLVSFQTMNDKKAYELFNKMGENASYKALLEASTEADIVLFGELHNNPIVHWLQYELTKDLLQNDSLTLVLGAEMFEADNQVILDEYFQGLISEKKFEEEARLWPNYATDYKPLVLLAKDNERPFIATNIPRRYANTVYKQGATQLTKLSDDAKTWIAPMPIKVDLELPAYKSMLDMMGGHGAENAENFPMAQAVKDATMAHFILENWTEGQLFMHYNGAFHSNNWEGIVWYLQQQKKELNILTISAVEQDNINALTKENTGLADFTIAIPTTMTKTY